MVRLSTIARKSGGTIRTATGRTVSTPTRRSDITRANPDNLSSRKPSRSESAIKDDAIAQIKRSNPDLFRTPDQIRQAFLPGILNQFNLTNRQYRTNENIAKSRRVNVELGRAVDNAVRDQGREAERLVTPVFKRLFIKSQAETAEVERNQQTDTVSRRNTLVRDEARAAERDSRNKSTRVRSDEEAEFAIKNDPDLNDKFTSVQTIFSTIEDQPPEKREELLKQLEDQANALVDAPFEQEKQTVNSALRLKLDKLNADMGLFSEQQKFELDRTIDSLDRDSAESLNDTLESLASRGVLDSGLLRRIANEVVEKREIGVQEVKKIADFRLRGERSDTEFGKSSANLQANQAILGIEQNQDFARRSRFMDLLELNNDQLSFLEEVSGAGRVDIDGGGALPGGTRSTGRPGDSSFTSTSSIVEPAIHPRSSLEQARKFKQENTPIEVQQRERAAFLSAAAAKAPTSSSSKRIPASSLNRSSITASNTPGSTPESRVALRRLSRS